jgi:hypothetical protein
LSWIVTGTGVMSGRCSAAPVSADTSRATPWIDRHDEDLVVQVEVLADALANGRVFRQHHQAAMVFRQLQLARGAQHAVAIHAAQLADLDLERLAAVFGRGQHGAHQRARHLDAGLDVGRATDDLQGLAGAGIDLAHIEAVGVGMALGRQHVRNHHLVERRRDRPYLFDFQPGHGQGVRQRVGGNLFRVGEGAKPGFRELHGASDPVSILCIR